MGASLSTRAMSQAGTGGNSSMVQASPESNDMSEETDLAEALMNMPTYREETFEEKLYRKVTKEPLVPIGCGITTYFLCSGIRSFMNRDSARSQKMMRGRVAAQAFTILAFCTYAGFENVEFLKFRRVDSDEQKDNK